jgi:hypothetical protein
MKVDLPESLIINMLDTHRMKSLFKYYKINQIIIIREKRENFIIN